MKKYKITRYASAQALNTAFRDGRKRHSLDKYFSPGKVISFYIITAVAFILTALYAIFKCEYSYVRLFESIYDLFLSIAYYGTLVFPFYEIEPTVNNIPDSSYVSFLPESFEVFQALIQEFFSTVFNLDNFLSYLNMIGEYTQDLTPVIILILPLILIAGVIPGVITDSYNAKWFDKTVFLKFFYKVKDKLYFPIKRYILDYLVWHRGHYFYNVLIFIWLCNLNFITVFVGFFAWYFYFAKSFDLLSIWNQCVKLSIDILIYFDSSFAFLTLSLSYWFYNRVRKTIGYNILRSHEGRNQVFVNSMALCTLVCGPMGTGKTQAIVDMALSKAVSFRNQALERMYKYELYFPDFNWFKFEKYILLRMKRRQILNLATIEDVLSKEREDFELAPSMARIYFYDITRYPLYRTVGNKVVYIWNALETYAKLYLIYIISNSLIIANFSIREDYLIINAGNFILYDHDFFTHPMCEDTMHFCHILNHDILRMGKTFLEDSLIKNCLEFGIVVITEIGKERGNGPENLHVRKDAAVCNVKNDLFVFKLKMARHAGTVDNYCFICFIFDEQRPQSLAADLREVCDLLIIKKKSPMLLAYPLFYLENLIYEWLTSHHKGFHYAYRHSHGNRSLLSHLLVSVVSVVFLYVEGIFQMFGYSVLTFSYVQANGTDETGERRELKYYLSYAKIYNYRYATDTHAQYCRDAVRHSNWSFDESPMYTSLHASYDDLRYSNSHFVRDMLDLSGGNSNEL